MIGKYLGDELKKSLSGDEYLVSNFEIDGRKKSLSKSKMYTGELKIGLVYELTTWQTPGKKTIFINSAKLAIGAAAANLTKSTVDSTTTEQSNIPSTNGIPKSSSPVSDSEKMTKADWNQKDQNIKWLTCLKAASDFHARRSESSIEDVIVDAQALFCASAMEGETTADTPKESDPFEGL